MPQIVSYDQRTETPGVAFDPHVVSDTGLGQAVGGLMGEANRVYSQVQHQDDQDAAKKADVALTTSINNTLYTGDNPFMGMKGEDAVNNLEPTLQQLHQAYQDASAGLSGRQKEMFDSVALPKLAGYQGDLQRFGMQQKGIAFDATSIARQNMSLDDHARYAVEDPVRAQANLESAISEQVTRDEANGVGAEVTQDSIRQLKSTAWQKATLTTLGTYPDPHQAEAVFNAHTGEMDPLVAA